MTFEDLKNDGNIMALWCAYDTEEEKGMTFEADNLVKAKRIFTNSLIHLTHRNVFHLLYLGTYNQKTLVFNIEITPTRVELNLDEQFEKIWKEEKALKEKEEGIKNGIPNSKG